MWSWVRGRQKKQTKATAREQQKLSSPHLSSIYLCARIRWTDKTPTTLRNCIHLLGLHACYTVAVISCFMLWPGEILFRNDCTKKFLFSCLRILSYCNIKSQCHCLTLQTSVTHNTKWVNMCLSGWLTAQLLEWLTAWLPGQLSDSLHSCMTGKQTNWLSISLARCLVTEQLSCWLIKLSDWKFTD